MWHKQNLKKKGYQLLKKISLPKENWFLFDFLFAGLTYSVQNYVIRISEWIKFNHAVMCTFFSLQSKGKTGVSKAEEASFSNMVNIA